VLDVECTQQQHQLNDGIHLVLLVCFRPFFSLSFFFLTTDFWTVRCTRCPASLDQFNDKAAEFQQQPQKTDPNHSTMTTNKNVRCMSICCGDSLDAAREILEEPDDQPKWSHVSHYFMDVPTKERAKTLLQFHQVPFYVVLDEHGSIVHTATYNNFDWETHVVAVVAAAASFSSSTAPPPVSPETHHKNLRTSIASNDTKREEPSPNSAVFIVDDDLDF
jgi:hypothetical protein